MLNLPCVLQATLPTELPGFNNLQYHLISTQTPSLILGRFQLTPTPCQSLLLLASYPFLRHFPIVPWHIYFLQSPLFPRCKPNASLSPPSSTELEAHTAL